MKNLSKNILSFIFISQIKPFIIPLPLIFFVFGLKKIFTFRISSFVIKELKIFQESILLKLNAAILIFIGFIPFLPNVFFLHPDYFGNIWFARELISFLILPLIAISYFENLSKKERINGLRFFYIILILNLIIFFINRELAFKIMSLTYSKGGESFVLATSSILFRIQLIGFKLFGGALSLATISCLTYFYYFKNRFNLKGISLIILSALLSVLMARSSFMVYLIFFLNLIYANSKIIFSRLKIKIIKLRISSLFTIALIFLVTFLSIFFIALYLPNYFSWLTEGLPFIAENSYNSSFNDLTISWQEFSRYNFYELIFPSFRLFEGSNYFRNIDIGYARLIFHLGIPGFAILVISLISYLKIISNKLKIPNLEINFIIVVTLFSWLKGIYWPIQPFAFLLFLRVNQN